MYRAKLVNWPGHHPILENTHLIFSIALITGGGSGVGAMIATAFVQNGAKVYIASRKEAQLKEVGAAFFVQSAPY
jgi:NADP-dependent 3-hydroxy acid dehydrogenase YdfG